MPALTLLSQEFRRSDADDKQSIAPSPPVICFWHQLEYTYLFENQQFRRYLSIVVSKYIKLV